MPRKFPIYRGTRPKKAAAVEDEVEVYCELCELPYLITVGTPADQWLNRHQAHYDRLGNKANREREAAAVEETEFAPTLCKTQNSIFLRPSLCIRWNSTRKCSNG